MWSEISGKYIYVNNKPYIAAQQEEPQVPVYVSMDNKKRYNPLEGVAKSPNKNLIKLLTLEQYQTPFIIFRLLIIKDEFLDAINLKKQSLKMSL